MNLRFWPRNTADDVRRELEFHLELLTRELEAGGLSPQAARAEAARRFGDRHALDATLRRYADEKEQGVRRAEWFDALQQDVRFAIRQLIKTPAFTAIAVLTLAIGTGATSAIFSVVQSVVLRPWPWVHPERVMMVAERWKEYDGNVSVGNYMDWAKDPSFAHLAAEQFSSFNIADPASPERVSGGRVTSNFFDVFGTPAAIGRTFLAGEDQPGNELVAVLSHDLWMRRFAGDSSAVGRMISISGRDYQVVGVMPPGYDPTASAEQMWVPIAFTPAQIRQHDEHYLLVFGAMREGVSAAQAQASLSGVMAHLREQFPLDNQGRSVRVADLSGTLIGDLDSQLYVLLGAVALVLLIACGNVANLLLARGSARAKEIAIRSAIGAGRSRIVRQLLTESAVLGLLATTAGLVVAYGSIRGLLAIAPSTIPRLDQTHMDGTVLAFAASLAVVCSMIFGFAPAWRAGRQDVQRVLKEGGRGMGGARDRVRAALIIGEVAFALTLLVGAGLLIRSGLYLQRVAPGFDPSGVLTARLTLPATAYQQPERVVGAFDDVVRELNATRGVQSAAAVSQAPLGPGGSSNGLLPEGKALDVSNLVDARLRIVTPQYLTTMRIPLRRGRGFTEHDVLGTERVMIISEALAARLWPGEDAVGKRVACCEGTPQVPLLKTVVGVAGDVRSRGPAVDVAPEFYLPAAQAPVAAWTWVQRSMTLVVRGTGGNTAPLVGVIRAAVRKVDPLLPVFRMNSALDDLRASTAQTRFYTTLLTSLGAVGLLLALVGIYGVIAYLVTLRGHEIGVRMALGATAFDVVRLMTFQGMRLVTAGIVLGAGASYLASGALRTVLYGVQEHDPVTLGAVALLLFVVGLVATLIPTRRAAAVNPTRALQA